MFVLCLFSIAKAQTIFSPGMPATGPLSSQALLQFSINNAEKETRTFSVQGVITDQFKNRVASFSIMPFQVNPGLFSSSAAGLRFTRFEPELEQARAYFNQHGILPPETYTVCYQLNDGQSALPEVCVSISATENTRPVSEKKKTLMQRALSQVNFYGSAQLEQVVASRRGTATEVPQNFTRFMANPGISLFNIPVSANVFLSTENSASRQPMNIVSLSFDQQMFIQNLQSAVARKLMEENQKKLSRYGDVLNSVKDYQQLESTIESPEFRKEQEMAKDMDALSRLLGPSEQQWISRLQSGSVDGEQLNAIFSLEEAMKNLPAGSQGSQDLQAKKDSLMQVSGLSASDLKDLSSLDNTLAAKGMDIGKVRELEAKKNMAVKLYQRYETLKKTRDLIKAEGVEDQIKDLQNFDFSSLNNPVILREYAGRFGLENRLTKWLFGFRHLSVGSIFPVISPLVLEGLQVSGVSAEINPGILNLGLTTGIVNRQIINREKPEKTSLERRIISGKIGLGKSDQSGFYLHFMRIHDPKDGFVADSSRPAPQANFVFGPEARISLFRRRVLFTGSGFVSQYIRDQNASTFQDETVEKVNQEIRLYPFLFPVNTSTSIDYSFDVNGVIDLGKNLFLTAGSRYIGPGYVSLGNPFLRNDLRRYEGRIEKRMFKNRFIIGGFVRNEHDNLFQFKNIKTERSSFGAQADLRMPGWPGLRLVYSPMVQTNILGDFVLNNVVASLNHSYRLGKLQMASNFNTSLGYSRAPVEQPRYNSLAVSLMQTFFFEKFSLNFTWNQTRNQIAGLEESMSVLDAALNLRLSEKWMLTTAYNLSESRENSSLHGLRTEASWRLNQWMDFNLRYLNNRFSSRTESSRNFNENLLNLMARFYLR
jgi:hypothetical protein